MNQKLVIDLGNCILSYAGYDTDGTVKTGYVYSTYTTTIETDIENVVEFNGTRIKLGARDLKAIELANPNKSRREYLEHQILLAAYKMLGGGTHYVKLGTGMPIADILNENLRNEFLDKLKNLGTLNGTVENKSITVVVIPEEVQLFAEGHATRSVLESLFSKQFGNLVIDCGLKTTDVALFDWDPLKNSYVPTKTFSIEQGLETILTPIQTELDRHGVQYKLTYLDRRIREEKYIVRTETGEYNLLEALMQRRNECITLLTAIQNRLGEIGDTNKFMVGGGCDILLKIIPNALKHMQEIPADMRFNANILGYLAYM